MLFISMNCCIWVILCRGFKYMAPWHASPLRAVQCPLTCAELAPSIAPQLENSIAQLCPA